MSRTRRPTVGPMATKIRQSTRQVNKGQKSPRKAPPKNAGSTKNPEPPRLSSPRSTAGSPRYSGLTSKQRTITKQWKKQRQMNVPSMTKCIMKLTNAVINLAMEYSDFLTHFDETSEDVDAVVAARKMIKQGIESKMGEAREKIPDDEDGVEEKKKGRLERDRNGTGEQQEGNRSQHSNSMSAMSEIDSDGEGCITRIKGEPS